MAASHLLQLPFAGVKVSQGRRLESQPLLEDGNVAPAGVVSVITEALELLVGPRRGGWGEAWIKGPGPRPQKSPLTCHEVSAWGWLSSLLTDKRKSGSCQLGESACQQAGGVQLIEGNEGQSAREFLRVPGWGPAKDPRSPWPSYSLSLKCIIHDKQLRAQGLGAREISWPFFQCVSLVKARTKILTLEARYNNTWLFH